MAERNPLQLLLTHTEEAGNEPALLQGLPVTALGQLGPVQAEAPRLGRRAESAQPDDLAQQRWGVVVPEGEQGDRLLRCIEPLRNKRQQEQEGFTPRVFRTPAGAPLTAAEAQRWRDEVYDELSMPPEQRLGEEDQPAYLLILGDLHQVPEAVHRVLSGDCFVGRLAFSTAQGEPDYPRYETYVDKVLRWEARPAPVSHAQTRFCVVDDGTSATTLGRLALVEPALAIARQDLRSGKLRGLDEPSLAAVALREPSELLALSGQPHPTVLFSVSHGAGAPRGGWKHGGTQRLVQGALSFGGADRLTGDDIKDRAFLPGGVWFMLACYGAGTPAESQFAHWLDQLCSVKELSGDLGAVRAGLPRPAERPFIAALPQAALGNPEGPLAFMGHLDLAWTYGFQEQSRGSSRSRPTRFLNLVKALLRRHRVGVAFRELTRYVNNINLEITALIDRAAATGVVADAAQLGHLWMLRQDLMGYVLLGDPAVRLPLATGSGAV